MSDTPLTDENLWVGIHGCFKTSKTDGKGYIPESLSRELERELNAAKARIARLEEAGNALDASVACGCGIDGPCKSCSWALDRWHQAKEDKP